jgi:hypothetical protein
LLLAAGLWCGSADVLFAGHTVTEVADAGGDFGNSFSGVFDLGALTLGTHTVSGASSLAFISGGNSADLDTVTFTIPVGLTVSSIFFEGTADEGTPTAAFRFWNSLAIAGNFGSPDEETAAAGINPTANLMSLAPSFLSPLTSGVYSLELSNTGSAVPPSLLSYDLTFFVVPEPNAWMLLAIMCGTVLVMQRRRPWARS